MANNMNRNSSSKNISLSWGDGGTDLFLAPGEDGLELLDYEFDFERIHKMCGGKCYYQSRSGCSGAGYIKQYGDLTRVGYYRVDTVYNEFQYPEKLSDDVSIMIPYASHDADKAKTLTNHPVIIMVGSNTIIYCDFFNNMNEVLSTVLSGKNLGQSPRILRRTFINTRSFWNTPEIVELKFYNLFRGCSYYPWEFVTDRLKDYGVNFPSERLYNIFHVSTCEDGTIVRTVQIERALYATEVLKSDPLENLAKPLPGWKLSQNNMLYKVRENEVYVVGWELASEAYDREIERVAHFLPAAKVEGFKLFVKGHLPSMKYIEFELNVPKLLFFLNKEKQFDNVRKGIAAKVREDVFAAARQFVADYNDKKILEEIPDELVITLEDSYAAGNCRPGTQAFVDKYFPGKRETTAGELKKYADNSSVMRVFKYIATRDMIDGKVKLEFPA